MNKETVKKLVAVDTFKAFMDLMRQQNNQADAYVEVDDALDKDIAGWQKTKKGLDEKIRKAKADKERLRGFMVQLLGSVSGGKVEGVSAKSVTYQEPKDVSKTVSHKQIMVKNRYVDLKDFSKDDLVSMLEDAGVKTRIKSSEVEETTAANIRVMR